MLSLGGIACGTTVRVVTRGCVGPGGDNWTGRDVKVQRPLGVDASEDNYKGVVQPFCSVDLCYWDTVYCAVTHDMGTVATFFVGWIFVLSTGSNSADAAAIG